jgi:hypothetical protein
VILPYSFAMSLRFLIMSDPATSSIKTFRSVTSKSTNFLFHMRTGFLAETQLSSLILDSYITFFFPPKAIFTYITFFLNQKNWKSHKWLFWNESIQFITDKNNLLSKEYINI